MQSVSTLTTFNNDVQVIDPETCQPVQVGGLSTGAIIGIAVGCVVFAALAVVGLVLLLRRRQHSFARSQASALRARDAEQMQRIPYKLMLC